MPDAPESRKRSRSPSTEAHGNSSDVHHFKRLNVGTDVENPRVEPVARSASSASLTALAGPVPTPPSTAAESEIDVAMAEQPAAAASGAEAFKAMVHMRCLILTQDASVIIGKGGVHIAEIRKKSAARVLVSEAIPGVPERILNISGQLENVAKAFGLISRRMNDEPFDVTSGPNSRPVTVRLAIPHQRMGSVIGKGGLKIKEIQDLSGAQLKASESVLPGSNERVLTIIGVADAIHIAAFHIGNVLLEAQKTHGAVQHALYRPGAPPMNFPGGPGPMPQGMMMQGRPGGFAGPPGPGFAPVPFNGQVPNNGFGPRPPGPPAPFAFGAGQQHFYPGAAQQVQPQQQRPPMMNVGPQPGGPGMGAPMGFGMGPGGMGGAGITHEVSVPADLIGSIIGKGGAKINEVRQMSASNVKILDPQPGAPAGANRRIVVSGAPQNVQMAVQMLNQRIEYERNKQKVA